MDDDCGCCGHVPGQACLLQGRVIEDGPGEVDDAMAGVSAEIMVGSGHRIKTAQIMSGCHPIDDGGWTKCSVYESVRISSAKSEIYPCGL